MSWYLPEDSRIGPYRAIKHRSTKELALAGKYGEIWQYSDKYFYALIRSAKLANQYSENPAKIGDETLVKFEAAELKNWVSRLKIPVNRPSLQLKWIENV